MGQGANCLCVYSPIVVALCFGCTVFWRPLAVTKEIGIPVMQL